MKAGEAGDIRELFNRNVFGAMLVDKVAHAKELFNIFVLLVRLDIPELFVISMRFAADMNKAVDELRIDPGFTELKTTEVFFFNVGEYRYKLVGEFFFFGSLDKLIGMEVAKCGIHTFKIAHKCIIHHDDKSFTDRRSIKRMQFSGGMSRTSPSLIVNLIPPISI